MAVFADHWQRYATLGWASFVLATDDKVPAIAGAGGFKSATTDPAVLAAWALTHPDANIGIATGRRSGIIVIDKDPRNGSHQTEARLATQGKTLPETVEAESCQGGRHLYYGYDTRIASGGTGRLGPGLDLKTDGGYVVAPPSVVKKRVDKPGAYRWIRPPRGNVLPKLPRWIIDALRPQPDRPARPARFDLKNEGDIGGLARFVAASAKGERNNRLFWAACRAAELVAGKRASAASAEDVLSRAAVSAGLSPSEATATIRSGLKGAQSS
jgi:hypothetical protein